MKFDLNNLNPGVFFPFEDDEEGGGVTVRIANGAIIEKIDKKCVKKKVTMRMGRREEIIEENKELRNKMLWDYIIIDWKGIFDINGDPIQCTMENKDKLMKGSVKFSSFVSDCISRLNEESEFYEEVLEKN